MELIELASTRIAVGLLEPYDRSTKRAVERRCALQLLRELLGSNDIEIAHRDDGAPYILCEKPAEPMPHLSISHSNELVAVAVDAHHRIGIDIEQSRDNLRRVLPRVLSPEELSVYGASEALMLKAWTLKEAAYKVADNPGADFRHDIHLPLVEKENTIPVATPEGSATCRIELSEAVAIAGVSAWLSVVKRLG